MDIVIDAEIEEEKGVVLKEFSTLTEVLAGLGIERMVSRIVIPSDIEAAVKKIQGDHSFKADREHQSVVAKVLHSDNGIVMLFSPLLFSRNVAQVRWLTYLHEMMHIFTRTVFPPIDTDSPSSRWYLTNLYILYDEYFANRKSLEMAEELFSQKTDVYRRHLRGFTDHCRTLIDESIFYVPLRREICSYAQHADIRLFLNRIGPIWDQGAKAIVYSYAFVDYRERNKRLQRVLSGSRFVNSRTVSLINFFRLKYEGGNFDLLSGMEVMKEFALNFGMSWKDMEDGYYNCYVHDI